MPSKCNRVGRNRAFSTDARHAKPVDARENLVAAHMHKVSGTHVRRLGLAHGEVETASRQQTVLSSSYATSSGRDRIQSKLRLRRITD